MRSLITILNKIFMLTVLMSIAGSIVSLPVLVAKEIIYKHTSADFVLLVYKLAMVSFILPMYILISIDNIIMDFVLYDPVVIVQSGSFKESAYSFLERINFAENITAVWFIGLIVYLGVHLLAYLQIRCYIKNSYEGHSDKVWQDEFERICMERNINKGKIKLLFCTETGQPCIVGMFKNAVLIPEYLKDSLSKEDISIILTHELIHAQKNDVLTKVLTFVLSSLNWFNPLLHILKREMYDWIECSCDEAVVSGYDRKRRVKYAKLLVRLNEEQYKASICVSAAFFNEGKNLKSMKRRIERIMKKENKTKRIVKVITLAGIIGTSLCATALAKEADWAVESVFSNSVAVMRDDQISETTCDENCIDEEEQIYIQFSDEEMINASEYISSTGTEGYIISEDGTIEEIPMNAIVIEPQHVHTYVNKNYKEHVKHDDGSCTVTTYACKVCSICGKMIVGDVISETSYKKCPH